MDKKKTKMDVMLDDLDFIRRCGSFYNQYEECISKKKDFDECYKVHYQEYINCYEKLKYQGY